MKKLQNRYENKGIATKKLRRRRPRKRVMGSGLLKSKKLETRIMGPGLVLLATEKKTLVEGHGRNMMVGHDGSSMLELVLGVEISGKMME